MACMRWMEKYGRWVTDDGRIYRPPGTIITAAKRERLSYALNRNNFRERKKASAKGETYHSCPDGHRRWHRRGECPVCK